MCVVCCLLFWRSSVVVCCWLLLIVVWCLQSDVQWLLYVVSCVSCVCGFVVCCLFVRGFVVRGFVIFLLFMLFRVGVLSFGCAVALLFCFGAMPPPIPSPCFVLLCFF